MSESRSELCPHVRVVERNGSGNGTENTLSAGPSSVKVARGKLRDATDPMQGMWDALATADCQPQGDLHDFGAVCPVHRGERRNLKVTEASDGRVLLKCFARDCDWRGIVGALGLDGRALFPVGHSSGPRAKPSPLKPRPLSQGAAFIDSLTLAGYRWTAAVLLGECPYCGAEHCVLRVSDAPGASDGRFVVRVDCSDGCGADDVRRAVETRAAIAERGVTL